MNEPVQNATFRIESRDDFVKVSGILKLVSTPDSPSDKIGNLDNPRSYQKKRSRVWNLSTADREYHSPLDRIPYSVLTL